METVIDAPAGVSPRHPNLLTPKQVATWLGVSDRWVRDHATRRLPRIPSVRLGSLLRFRREDVDEFIKTQRNDSDPRRAKWESFYRD